MFPSLPQGLLLLPVLFLFYNADLVKRKISNKKSTIAFIDNYTAWVVGESVETNVISLKKIINYTLAWESCSGAPFKSEKIALVYFIKNSRLRSNKPLNIKNINI